jgi:hypothetical protein
MLIMKYIKYFASTAICVAVMSIAAIASAQTVTQGVATVVRIQGSARYSSGDNVWHPLSTGLTLGANDVVETAANSTVDLVLGEKAARVNLGSSAGSAIGGSLNIAGLPLKPLQGSGASSAPQQNIIRIEADSEVAIDKFTYSQTGADIVTDTELNLKAGKIFGNVKKISAASEFIVKTPTGVAGIRGTGVYFGSDGSCTVVDGSAVISEIISTPTGNQTVTVTLSAGQSFDPATYNPAVSAQDQVTTLSPTALATAQTTAQTIVSTVNKSSTATLVVTATVNGSDVDVTSFHISPSAGSQYSF